MEIGEEIDTVIVEPIQPPVPIETPTPQKEPVRT